MGAMIKIIVCQFSLGAIMIAWRFVDFNKRCGCLKLRFERFSRACSQKLDEIGYEGIGTKVGDFVDKLKTAMAPWRPRWYWFHLIAQVGFMTREFIVISELNGWRHWQVFVSQTCMWVCLVTTASQVWHFSSVRNSGESEAVAKAIDKILDMLLLPINYGFLCALCVKTMVLQYSKQNYEMVLAIVDSADLWESWALLSVLGLFAEVVDSKSKHLVEGLDEWSLARARTWGESARSRALTSLGMFNPSEEETSDLSGSGSPFRSLERQVSSGSSEFFDDDNGKGAFGTPGTHANQPDRIDARLNEDLLGRYPSSEDFGQEFTSTDGSLNPVNDNDDDDHIDEVTDLSREALGIPIFAVGDWLERPALLLDLKRDGYQITTLRADVLASCETRSVLQMLRQTNLHSFPNVLLISSFCDMTYFTLCCDGEVQSCSCTHGFINDPDHTSKHEVVMKTLESCPERKLSLILCWGTCWFMSKLHGEPVLQHAASLQELHGSSEAFDLEHAQRASAFPNSGMTIPEVANVPMLVFDTIDIGEGTLFRPHLNVTASSPTYIELGRFRASRRTDHGLVDSVVDLDCHTTPVEGVKSALARLLEGRPSQLRERDDAYTSFVQNSASSQADITSPVAFDYSWDRHAEVDVRKTSEEFADACRPSGESGFMSLCIESRQKDELTSLTFRDLREDDFPFTFTYGFKARLPLSSLSSRRVSFIDEEHYIPERVISGDTTCHSPSHAGKTGEEYIQRVSSFKKLSLNFVGAWVLFLGFTSFSEIFTKGVLAPLVPTLCYAFLQDCINCDEFYDDTISTPVYLILYILCSIAICIVIWFERHFSEDLHSIQPFWKFAGVKCVVTVTFAQKLGLSYIPNLSESDVQMLHCTMICCEVPILCWVHTYYAYPYGGDWMYELVNLSSSENSEPSPSRFAESDSSLDVEAVHDANANPEATEPFGDGESVHSHGCGHRACFLFFLGNLCWWSVAVATWLLPPAEDMVPSQPWFNWTCNRDFTSFHLGSRHVALDTLPYGSLPRCARVPLGCRLGYNGTPVLKCWASGEVELAGSCKVVGCGTPSTMPHAIPVYENKQATIGWTFGMKVSYECNIGYEGKAHATCSENGDWKFDGACTMVGCGLLSKMGSALPELSKTVEPFKKNNSNVSFDGERIKFDCLPGLQGNPVATCTNKRWSLADACVPFTTSLGCKCQRTWNHCDGWFFSDCKILYGCGGVDASNTAWCLIEPGSCPDSARSLLGWEPFQDYCVDANYNITWAPKSIPGVDRYALLTTIQYVVVACIGFVISFVFIRRWTAQLSMKIPDLQAVRLLLYSLERLPATIRKHTRNWTYPLQVRWESGYGVGNMEPLLRVR